MKVHIIAHQNRRLHGSAASLKVRCQKVTEGMPWGQVEISRKWATKRPINKKRDEKCMGVPTF